MKTEGVVKVLNCVRKIKNPSKKYQRVWEVQIEYNSNVHLFFIILDEETQPTTFKISSSISNQILKELHNKFIHLIDFPQVEFYYDYFAPLNTSFILTKNVFLSFCNYEGDYNYGVLSTPEDRTTLSMEYKSGIKDGEYKYSNGGLSLKLYFKDGYIIEDVYSLIDLKGKTVVGGRISSDYMPLSIEDIIHEFEYENSKFKKGDWFYTP